MMLKEDRDKLKELMMNYPAKDLMAELSGVAQEVADDLSDMGAKEMAKDYVRIVVSLEDITSGRPFLI